MRASKIKTVCQSPKSCLKLAFKNSWIVDEPAWLAMLVDRNQTSCACNEALARAVDSRLRGYLSVRDARVVMGGVAPIPWRAAKAEEFLRGKRLDESTAKQAGEIALEGAKPLKDNIYKVKLAQDLIQPGLLASL